MKSINIQTLLLLLLALSVTSCKEKIETPFTGNDNRLLELSLTDSKGGKHIAKLTQENTFEMIVPSELDLEGAKVSYRISDQAEILPLPTEVKDWNNDQAFQVRSYSGDRRTYLVKIVREYKEVANSVQLVTDDDVKAFAAKGIRHIEGHLIIGSQSGTDSISNIDALTTLEKVDYNIIINPTYKGKDLSGLRNVKEAGSIILRSERLQNASLRKLTTVYENFEVNGSQIKEISLPELAQVNGALKISKVALKSVSLPLLEHVGSLSVLESKAISIISLRHLKTVSNKLELNNLEKLGSISLPNLEKVEGDIQLNALKILSSLSLNKLQSVSNITLKAVPLAQIYLNELKECKGLSCNSSDLNTLVAPQLKTIDGDLSLTSSLLSNLNQLGVEKITGNLTLNNLSRLQEITSFIKQLKDVAKAELSEINADGVWDFSKSGIKNLKIERCRNVAELVLPEVMENLTFTADGAKKIEKPIKLTGLKEVTKEIELSSFFFAKPIDFVIDIEKAGTISLRSITNLLSVNFPNLIEASRINYGYNTNAFDAQRGDPLAICALKKIVAPKLKSIDKLDFNHHDLEALDMPQLQIIKEKLIIGCYYPKNANNVLTNLNGLKALEKVNSVEFVNLKVFKDYSFLKRAVENGSLKSLSVGGTKYRCTLGDLKAGKYIIE